MLLYKNGGAALFCIYMQELSAAITEEMENNAYCSDSEGHPDSCPYVAPPPLADWEEEEEEEDSGLEIEVEETTDDEPEHVMQEAVGSAPAVADVIINEDDDEDEWVKFNLRDPDALSMYGSRLEEDGAPVPPVGKGEIACYYLGRLIYVHVYSREDDKGIKIDIRQWHHRQEGDDDEGSYEVIVTSQGLVMTWDEWKRILFYRKKIAHNSREIMADRPIEEKYEFGKNMFISVSWPYWCINLRSWFQKDGRGAFYPGQRGIALKFTEYERLMLLEEDLLRLSDQHEKRMRQRQQQTTAKKVKSSSQQPLSVTGIKRKAVQRCEEKSVTADTTILGKTRQQKQNRKQTDGGGAEEHDYAMNTSPRQPNKKRRIQN